MRKVFFVVLIYLVGVMVGLASAEEKIPVPEFYGLYFVSDENLIPARNAVGENRIKKEASDFGLLDGFPPFSGPGGVKELSGIFLSPRSYFLLYQRLIGDPGSLRLYRLEFVKRLSSEVVQGKWYEANMWILEKEIPLKVGPVKKQPDLYRLVPILQLEDGVYALINADMSGAHDIRFTDWVADFVVGKPRPSAQMPSQKPSEAMPSQPESSDPNRSLVIATKADLMVLHSAVNQFKMDTRRLPTEDEGLKALIEQPPDVQIWEQGGYLGSTSIPTDRWGHEFIYRLAPEGGKHFVIISLGADGQEGGEGYDADLYSTEAHLEYSIKAPEKITIDSLTKNIPDTDYFVAKSKIFDASFDIVWNAANEYLKKDHVIDVSDRNKGILTTKQMTNFLRDFKYQTFVLIEKISEDSTKVAVKGFAYKYNQYQSPSFTSELALRGIEKEIKKEVKKQEEQRYFVTIDGKEYKVSGDIFTGKKEGRVFKDEKGAVVRDLVLAKKIAQASWVYENVVKAPGIPNSQRVSAILKTHKSLRRYELTQDILARASVQILAATISGGATLTYTVPASLTWRVAHDQFVNLKGLLSLTGRQGLEEALSKYQQMEALIAKLKPNHIDEATAAEIKRLYDSAYGLDLPYSALLTSLMPKKGRQLVDKALKDIGDELVKTLPLSDAVLTTSEVLNLQGKMDDALKAAPALKEYYEKLNLAKRLKEANEQVISAWAEQAVQYKE